MEDIDFASYADDNTPYTIDDDTDQVVSTLEDAVEALFEWFSDNQMKSNSDKCHLLINKDCRKKITKTLQRMVNPSNY